MSARTEGASWNAEFVIGRKEDGYLVLEGTAWLDYEASLVIRLYLKAEVGATQVIDSNSGLVSAMVKLFPGYSETQLWSASRFAGSGTFTVTTLTATGATGTFSFTASALTDRSLPQSYRVTDGSFYVRF